MNQNRRATLSQHGRQVVVTLLVVTDGTRVYQLSCIPLKGHEHSANVEHFVSSFALVP